MRYATVYGERQHYRGVNALYIMENYDRIMRGEPPVIPDDGSEVHDYIHVSDVARANVMAMASDVTGESFNVASGVATNLNRVVELLLQITGSDLKPVYKPGASSVRSSVTKQLDFSLAKIEKMLGWKPEVSIEEGIRRLLEWRKAQDRLQASHRRQSMSEYEIFAIRYAHNAERRTSENFLGGDPHDGPMPMDFFVWVLKGGGQTIVIDTGFDADMAERRSRKMTRPVAEGLKVAASILPASRTSS